MRYLVDQVGIVEEAAAQIVDYFAAAKAALGLLPTQQDLVFERFFDEAGGTQLVIHSPYGSRVNRAWGLSLRKRFCRKFNFELQAAATEDAIILSLTATHSFQLDEVARYLNSKSVRELLVQALLDAPMFMTRWRWNASIALALLRFRGGNKVPPQLQRMQAEDLIAAVFPDQLACQENVVGDREIPDHPLVSQTIDDCLHEAMDIDGLERLLVRLESGAVRVTGRELTMPSPFALEILSARPYAFLDDAPLEERRTQAVVSRRWLDPESAADIGRLDPEAIARVKRRSLAQPDNADELHDALLWMGYVTQEEARANAGWESKLAELAAAGRATRLKLLPSPQPSARAGGRESPLDCRRARSRVSRHSSRRGAGASGQRASGIRREGVARGSSVDRSRARQAGGPRPGHRRSLHSRSGCRCRTSTSHCWRWSRKGFAMRGSYTARRHRDRVVRAPVAGAHQPLHGQAPAPGDRAGFRRGLHAVSAGLAAHRAGRTHGRPGCGRRDRVATGRLRGRCGIVGSGDPAHARSRIRAGLAG